MIKDFIGKVVEGRDLSADESAAAMTEIMEGRASDAQIACFITALRMKGETVDEITGCASVMRQKATRVRAEGGRFAVVDTCGTGGDRSGTFNISTAAALAVAGAGVTVAKHGNRSVSSHSGSADVLRTLGVNIEADIPAVERCLNEAGIGFLFAPLLHGAMKYAIGPRREIGVRTVFNILGPLTNPAGATCQVMGVYDGALTDVLAHVLRNLGSNHCFVVHGADGLDEITTTGPTKVSELVHGRVNTYEISPEDVGLQRARVEDMLVGSPAESAHAIRGVLARAPGPHRDIVLLNAAAALAAAGAAADLQAGVTVAAESLDSGRASKALDELVRITQAGA